MEWILQIDFIACLSIEWMNSVPYSSRFSYSSDSHSFLIRNAEKMFRSLNSMHFDIFISKSIQFYLRDWNGIEYFIGNRRLESMSWFKFRKHQLWPQHLVNNFGVFDVINWRRFTISSEFRIPMIFDINSSYKLGLKSA